MTLIFFSVKAENVYLTTMIKGAFKGAFLSFYSTLKDENHFQNESNMSKIQTGIKAPKSSLKSSFCNDCKV